MKKITYILVLILTVAIFASEVAAQTVTLSPTNTFKEKREELQNKLKELKEGRKDLRQDIKEKLKGKGIKIVNGEVTAKSEGSITVSKDGKNYTVLTAADTKFRRHFWGKSSFDEVSIGNLVNVFGKFTDDSQTTIQAHMIRNLSVQKRQGVFIGEVVSKDTSSFTIKTVNRGNQTVVYGPSTKFVARNETVISIGDVQVGHKVRVKGLWDKSLNKITDVVQVKDFSLPTK